MSNNQTTLSEIFPETKGFLKESWKKAGFEGLTAVQEKSSVTIYEGRDVLVEAPTGSGKTLAYLLPVLQKIDPEDKNIQVVILASSHELVMQIHTEIQKWSENSGIKSTSLIGGANIKRQLEKLKKKPQIVAGTPGRVSELIKQKKLKMHEVKTIVLDEGDQLIVPEHLPTVEAIVKSALQDRQLVLVSATLPNGTANTAAKWMNDPVTYRITNQETANPAVDYGYLSVEQREKTDILRKLSRLEGFQALVFYRDIGNLQVAAEKLEYRNVPIGVLHGDSKKVDRATNIRAFREGEFALLLATDVAARGLDIADLQYVINMDIPDEKNQFIHRAGRTGRMGSGSGTVLSIVTPGEEKKLKKIARDLKIDLQEKELYKGNLQNKKEVLTGHKKRKQ